MGFLVTHPCSLCLSSGLAVWDTTGKGVCPTIVTIKTIPIGHHRPKRQIITGKGKDIDEAAIQIKRSLEVEMDRAAERQVLKWFLHNNRSEVDGGQETQVIQDTTEGP